MWVCLGIGFVGQLDTPKAVQLHQEHDVQLLDFEILQFQTHFSENCPDTLWKWLHFTWQQWQLLGNIRGRSFSDEAHGEAFSPWRCTWSERCLCKLSWESWEMRHQPLASERVWVCEYHIWLVVWNIFKFSIYRECHHPNWRNHIFQRG